mmetsp:Transcript_25495/g.76079  ORF Transcript_25495/g.76079 Transcript_25495/m.76079 type:complete len:234 (-) Transcript_25495:53-754(-)|eukprot:CAMPEP_0175667882 /NCGR_PEP_ID=MMETSP0097-20121207/18335_1 /TAXON_ID=311494 /ORGANISM="Alexandrium monilatum, Strain CCMP3105" /LENGTH=233 /DNA_ID=CAMNT_0016974363 /DNA_START=41 /DNA_END=742 /DNA_ORIENTATION=+
MSLVTGTGPPASSMTITVSDLFTEYENDFHRLRQEIDEQLEVVKAGGSSEQQCLSEASRRAGRADQALRQMEMEARTLPPETRSHLDPAMKKYRSELSQCQKALDAARQAAARRELLDGAGAKSTKDRERLIGSTNALMASSRQLGEAHRQSLETEQIGLDVMSDLRQQREVILRTRANVGEIGNNTALAQRLLGSISRRAAANRYLVCIVAIIMAMMIIVAVYFMWKEEAPK